MASLPRTRLLQPCFRRLGLLSTSHDPLQESSRWQTLRPESESWLPACNDDALSKITLKSGVGTIMETGSDEGHFMALRCPVTLRHMRFRLTNLEGQVVQLGGSSLSFVLFLDCV